MDYYSILGVSKDADDKAIRKAYKQKSMQHHPDRGGDEEKFKQVNEAYSILKDPKTRGMYDYQQNGGGRAFDFNQHRQTNQNPFENHSDVFGNMFNDMRYARNRSIADITIAAKLTLEEILTGKDLIASYRLRNGKQETVNINVPAGVNDNQRIRFNGLGNEIAPGIRGDLFVKLEISKHRKWLREGAKLYAEHKVNALDMITGCVIVVETIDQRNIRLNIPAGTQTDTKFRLPGYGLPNVNTGKRDDAFVVISPIISKVTDENIIRKLKKLRNNLDN